MLTVFGTLLQARHHPRGVFECVFGGRRMHCWVASSGLAVVEGRCTLAALLQTAHFHCCGIRPEFKSYHRATYLVPCAAEELVSCCIPNADSNFLSSSGTGTSADCRFVWTCAFLYRLGSESYLPTAVSYFITMIAGVLLIAQMGARKPACGDPDLSRNATAWDITADETWARSLALRRAILGIRPYRRTV